MSSTDSPDAAPCGDSSGAPRRSLSGRAGLGAGAAVCALAVAWLSVGTSWLRRAENPAGPSAAESPLRVVKVTRPEHADIATLTLPANVDAFQTTLVYARVNGYLLRRHVEIGDHVQKGQMLAEIDTPEADQELVQARAALVQGQADLDTAVAELQEAEANLKQADADIARVEANLEYARTVLKRNEQLNPQHAISIQELEGSRRDYDASQADRAAMAAQHKTRESTVATNKMKIKSREATVSGLEANVRRLEELQGFKTIRAPFDGIVTRRRAEIGILVTAGSASTACELFAVAQADILRIHINVPQSHAPSIRTGQEAQVLVPEFPGRVFAAKVARTSRSIDPGSRTLMVELELPNADYAVLPGTYAQVTLPVRRVEPMCTIPTSVLLTLSEGVKVAVVDGQNVVSLRKVTLGRDYGRSVEVLGGLVGDEALVLNPPDNLAEHEKVTIAGASDAAASPGGAAVAAHNEPKPRS